MNKITIDIDAIKASLDNSITDPETIRQIALYSIETGDDEITRKIKNEFAFVGLYPHIMKPFNIMPEKLKK